MNKAPSPFQRAIISLLFLLFIATNSVHAFPEVQVTAAPPINGWLHLSPGSSAKAASDPEINVGDTNYTVELLVYPSFAFNSQRADNFLRKPKAFQLGYESTKNTYPWNFNFSWGVISPAGSFAAVYLIPYPWGRPYNGWDHIAYVSDKDNEQVSLYLNGILNKTVTAHTASNATDLLLGH